MSYLIAYLENDYKISNETNDNILPLYFISYVVENFEEKKFRNIVDCVNYATSEYLQNYLKIVLFV